MVKMNRNHTGTHSIMKMKSKPSTPWFNQVYGVCVPVCVTHIHHLMRWPNFRGCLACGLAGGSERGVRSCHFLTFFPQMFPLCCSQQPVPTSLCGSLLCPLTPSHQSLNQDVDKSNVPTTTDPEQTRGHSKVMERGKPLRVISRTCKNLSEWHPLGLISGHGIFNKVSHFSFLPINTLKRNYGMPQMKDMGRNCCFIL